MYIEDGFYVADIRRKTTTAKQLLIKRIGTCSLGKHIGKAVAKDFEVLEDEEIIRIRDPDFRTFLRKWEQGK
jgi:tRNA nucleotidyltransferase (CCA-adding enzyme)